MATIFEVADFFRWRVMYESGDNMTHLKLQKLCYYAQAWHVTATGERLFDEEFEHWEHGPANYALYKKFQDHKWQPIDPGNIYEEFFPAEVFSMTELDTLLKVWDTYGKYTAKYLEGLTHQEDPWINTTKNEVISIEAMKEYYTRYLITHESDEIEEELGNH